MSVRRFPLSVSLRSFVLWCMVCSAYAIGTTIFVPTLICQYQTIRCLQVENRRRKRTPVHLSFVPLDNRRRPASSDVRCGDANTSALKKKKESGETVEAVMQRDM